MSKLFNKKLYRKFNIRAAKQLFVWLPFLFAIRKVTFTFCGLLLLDSYGKKCNVRYATASGFLQARKIYPAFA